MENDNSLKSNKASPTSTSTSTVFIKVLLEGITISCSTGGTFKKYERGQDTKKSKVCTLNII